MNQGKVAALSNLIPKNLLHREDVRLKTFDGWKNENVSIKELAMFGFYWIGYCGGKTNIDTTKCYFCNVEISKWIKDDDVLTEHERLSRHCKFILRFNTDNVPIDAKLLNSRLSPPTAARVLLQMDKEDADADDDICRFIIYADEKVRSETFKNWPNAMPIKAKDLYKAGFFYTGNGDCVVCFYCGLCLRQWTRYDDPLVNHVEFSYSCKFLRKQQKK